MNQNEESIIVKSTFKSFCELFKDTDSDEDDFDELNEDALKNYHFIEILHKNNVCYGVSLKNTNIELNKKLPSNFEELNTNKKIKLLQIDKDKENNVKLIGYAPIGNYLIKYKSIVFQNQILKKEIKKLLKYSYCFHKSPDDYFFPQIKLVIWTNKSLNHRGYYYYVYEYGHFDEVFKKDELDLINNKKNYQKGEFYYEL